MIWRNIVGPVLTNRATIEFLKRKAPLAALKDACTAQLKNLQVELEAIYEKDGLGNALGTLGADVVSRSSKTKSAVARQDSDGLLPTISGTGLTEDGYVHVLHLLGVSLDAVFHENMRTVLTEENEVVAAAVATAKEAGVEGAAEEIYRAAPPKSVARMLNKLQTDHASMKRPR